MPENVEDKAESTQGRGFGSDLFWRVLATVILISVLWILWLLWQITPKSAVNPVVFQIQQNRQSATGTIQRAPEPAQPSAGVAPGSVLSSGSPLESLKMDTELKSPPASTAEPAKQ